MDQCKVITIANQKSGTSITTTACNLDYNKAALAYIAFTKEVMDNGK